MSDVTLVCVCTLFAACSDVQSIPLGEVAQAGAAATSTRADAERASQLQPPMAARPAAPQPRQADAAVLDQVADSGVPPKAAAPDGQPQADVDAGSDDADDDDDSDED